MFWYRNVPGTEMFWYRNVLVPKCAWYRKKLVPKKAGTEKSWYRNVLLPKKAGTEMFRYRKVHTEMWNYRNVPYRNVKQPYKALFSIQVNPYFNKHLCSSGLLYHSLLKKQWKLLNNLQYTVKPRKWLIFGLVKKPSFAKRHLQVTIKVLFKDLNPGIAMAIVRFKFSRKLYFCFVSVIRQKFNFSAFSEMAQNFWFWLHWMKRNYVFVLVDDKVSKFKSIQNWNWKFLLNFLEIAIKVIHFLYYLI